MERCGAKVTIITAVYNGAAYIKRAIDSIAEQTYDNIEYIVVDGGSTDGTVDILRQHSNVVTRFISEPDKGIYDAMNKGVKMATGNVFHRGRVQDGAFTAYKLSKYPIPHQAILYPRVVFEKYSYDLRYKISADHYLTIKCWHDRKIKFKYCDLVLARYSEGGFSTQGDVLFQLEKPQIIRQNFSLWVYLRYRYRLYKYRNKVQWYDKTIE